MRVLMLSRPDAFSVSGGDTIQMMAVAEGLQQMGVEVDVDVVGKAGSLRGYDVVHVFNWEQLEPVLELRLSEPAPDVPVVLSPIFSFGIGHWYDSAARIKPAWRFVDAIAGERRGRRIYCQWQDLKLRFGGQGKRVRAILDAVDWLFPISSTELEMVIRLSGAKGDIRRKSTIVPNGIVADRYQGGATASTALPLPQAPFVLQVSRIQSEKNQLGLIRALSGVPVPIVFAGRPSPYDPEYVRECYEAGAIRGDVHFLGEIPHENMRGLYERAAVHVLPSYREVMPLVCLEAAAAGCRIVSTVVGGVREYFGEKAWYCEPGNPKSIRKAVLAALRAPRTEVLKSLVLGEYTWERAARKTLDGYMRVVPEKRLDQRETNGSDATAKCASTFRGAVPRA